MPQVEAARHLEKDAKVGQVDHEGHEIDTRRVQLAHGCRVELHRGCLEPSVKVVLPELQHVLPHPLGSPANGDGLLALPSEAPRTGVEPRHRTREVQEKEGEGREEERQSPLHAAKAGITSV